MMANALFILFIVYELCETTMNNNSFRDPFKPLIHKKKQQTNKTKQKKRTHPVCLLSHPAPPHCAGLESSSSHWTPWSSRCDAWSRTRSPCQPTSNAWCARRERGEKMSNKNWEKKNKKRKKIKLNKPLGDLTWREQGDSEQTLDRSWPSCSKQHESGARDCTNNLTTQQRDRWEFEFLCHKRPLHYITWRKSCMRPSHRVWWISGRWDL